MESDKPATVKFIRVLEGNRSREVGIAMAKLPAARHIKQAILNMDPSHITRESITVSIFLDPVFLVLHSLGMQGICPVFP